MKRPKRIDKVPIAGPLAPMEWFDQDSIVRAINDLNEWTCRVYAGALVDHRSLVAGEGIAAVQLAPGCPLTITDQGIAFNYGDAQLNHYIASVAGSSSSSGIVLVQNSSGSAVDRFGILGIDAPAILPEQNAVEFENRVVLDCITPSLADHAGRFVILLEPLADGQIGRAWAAGVCQVKLNVAEDEDWRYADVADGESGYLEPSNTGSAAILWREGGTGEQWAVVRLGVAPTEIIPCRIASSAAIAAANNGPSSSTTEWTYSVTPVSLDVASGDVTTTDLAKPVITTAYNGMEKGNRSVSSGGTFGNGVKYDDLDDDDVTGSLQAVKAGTIVEVRLFAGSDGNTYGLFSSPNGVSVECDEEE